MNDETSATAMLRLQLETRLADLKDQFTRGQERLTQLDGEMAQLRQTLLRISGAIQVLEEELGKAPGDGEQAH